MAATSSSVIHPEPAAAVLDPIEQKESSGKVLDVITERSAPSLDAMNSMIDSGGVFAASAVFMRHNGLVQIQLGPDIYSWGMHNFLQTQFSSNDVFGPYGCFYIWAIILPMLLLVIFTFWMQWNLLGALSEIAVDNRQVLIDQSDGGEDLCQYPGGSDYLVRTTTLFVFTLSFWAQFGSSLGMIRWLAEIPTYSASKHKHICDELGCNLGWRTLRTRISDPAMPDISSEYQVTRPAIGITMARRVLAVLLFILPKMLVELLLLVKGGGFLLTSHGNQNVILNTLAVTFVCDIDEMFYATFVVKMLKGVYESLPPIGMLPFGGNVIENEELKNAKAWRIDSLIAYAGTWISYAILLLLNRLIYLFWCSE